MHFIFNIVTEMKAENMYATIIKIVLFTHKFTFYKSTYCIKFTGDKEH